MTSRSTTRWVVALTGIGSLMAALDTLVVSTALSKIGLDLGASIEQLEWTVNAYNLSFAVLLITGAALGEAVFAATGSDASPPAFTACFGPAIGVAAALALAGAIVGLALPGRRSADAASAPLLTPIGEEAI